ncbi:Putative ABC transporter substrate-binding protein YesO [Paenibacillus sp. CECT 9249]|uniref:ABC transporter substrate-binding protein n=1 Tax=Paenibacillus sp. CECT 9249 TaxID=2845385 RepID=UPI001E4D6AEE|nr:extracellular solute-binding protein [Paenibacillus sp. CECT 9249]CAH0121658.1 Putative ABC transporter substrate-binding protein YesO [Paenibacillus sp. CECT 9249]
MKKWSWKWITLSLVTLFLAACSAAPGTNSSQANTGTDQRTTQNRNANETGIEQQGASSGGRKTIVFATFWPNEQYEQAIKAYEADHPGIEIKLQYGLSTPYSDEWGDEAQMMADMEKYVTSTNAAMLAGQGPDLLDLRYLSAEDYAARHLLDDLGKRMDQDKTFRKDDYFTRVLESGKSDEGLFSVPLTFSLSGMIGNQAALAQTGVKIDDRNWTWNDFVATGRKLLAAKGPYQAVISNGEGMIAAAGHDYFVRSIMTDNYGMFVDEAKRTAHFNSQSFSDLLKQIKSMFDEGIIAGGPAYFSNITLSSPTDYLTSLRMFGEQTAFYVKPHATGAAAGATFATGYHLAVNAKSKVKDEAWDFLKYLLRHTSIGFPVNKQLYLEEVQKLKEKGTITPDKMGPLQGKTFNVDAAQLDLLENFVDQAAQERNGSGKVLDMVVEESAAFFAGQKSAEDVARLLQNKATTFLNE